MEEIVRSSSSAKPKVEFGKAPKSSSDISAREIQRSTISSGVYIPHDSGKRKNKMSNDSNLLVNATYGLCLVEGHNLQPMEDDAVAEIRKTGDYEIGLFALFDGYESHSIPHHLKSNLFNNILAHPAFLLDTETAVREGYRITEIRPTEKSNEFGFSGKSSSTAVTEILMNCKGQSSKPMVANVGDSRAVICCQNGKAKQLSTDHNTTNETERKEIKMRGGFIAKLPAGYVPGVNALVPLTRAFGVKFLKKYISCEPNMVVEAPPLPIATVSG